MHLKLKLHGKSDMQNQKIHSDNMQNGEISAAQTHGGWMKNINPTNFLKIFSVWKTLMSNFVSPFYNKYQSNYDLHFNFPNQQQN